MADPTNTPMPPGTPAASTPRSTSPATSPAHPRAAPARAAAATRPRVLHIGDPVKYNLETYASFSAQCDIVRPSTPERSRPEFVAALRGRRWGDFDAVFRPFWGTGGEMGRWDAELIGALPEGVRVFASAGAGFDWADTKLMGERGELSIFLFDSSSFSSFSSSTLSSPVLLFCHILASRLQSLSSVR